MGAPRNAIAIALAAASVIALLFEFLRRSSARFRTQFELAFGSLLRSREKTGISGATWLALSCFVCVVSLSRSAAIAALWCAAVGDPAGTIAGRWISGSPNANRETGGKTIVGSIGCLTASFAGVWMLAGYSPAIAIVVAVAATVAEAWPVTIDDNVRVAAAAGAIAQFLA
jgi:dolichol kinase